jgi:DNA-binding response OmpR family regulator
VTVDVDTIMSAKTRILFVEDNGATRQALAAYFTALGYDVIAAADVRTAEALAESHAPDLVVSDIELPDGDGLQLMRSLRARRDLAGIAVSGHSDEWLHGACHEAGFSAFFIKPARLTELRLAIERALQVRLPGCGAGRVPPRTDQRESHAGLSTNAPTPVGYFDASLQ